MAAGYLGPNNGFLPVPTQQIVAYVRDPKKFKINEYVQQVRSPAPNANYLKLDRHAPARLMASAQYAWSDGAKRPDGHWNLHNFVWTNFQTERRAFPFSIGNQAIAAAKKFGGWDPAATHSAMVAQQAITDRTRRVITKLETDTAANWGNNRATADTLNDGAGFWDFASSNETDANFNAISRSILEGLRRINLETNALVQPEDLCCIVSPTAALRMANTGEIHSYMKGSRYSLHQIEGKGGMGTPKVNDKWGIPEYIRGVKMVVEDAVVVSAHPYAGDSTEPSESAGTRTYVKAENSAILVTRKGGLDAPFGGPNYSTIQCYWYSERGEDGGELEIEVRSDDWHRYTEGSCIEQYIEELAAAPTGFLIKEILS